MATYKQIQSYVKDKYKVSIKTCWIADIKGKHNLLTRIASNRKSSNNRLHPCPMAHQSKIEEAFRFFRMIK